MYPVVKRRPATVCMSCGWMVALLVLLPRALAGQASDASTTPHVDVGVIAGMGGNFLPKRYLGITVSSPTWRAHRIEIGAMATLLQKVWHSNRDRVWVLEDTDGWERDTSYLSTMARVGAEVRVGLSSHVAAVVRTGVVYGAWRDLPKLDASRADHVAPFGGLGAAVSGRRWALDAMLVGWKLRLGRPRATGSFEATIRRRL